MQGIIIGEHVLIMLILTKMMIAYLCYNCVTFVLRATKPYPSIVLMIKR